MATRFSIKPPLQPLQQNNLLTSSSFNNQQGNQFTGISPLGYLGNLFFRNPSTTSNNLPPFAQSDFNALQARLNPTQNAPIQSVQPNQAGQKPVNQNADIIGGTEKQSAVGVNYNSVIDRATGSQQIDNKLSNAPMDMLGKIFDMLSQKSDNQVPNILGYLSQARNEAGLPQLQNQFTDITGRLNTLNQGYFDALQKISTTPDLTGFQVGARENALNRAANPLIGQLQAQQQTLGTQLGIGQQNVAQGLGAAETQAGLGFQQQQLAQQRQLGLAGLAAQIFGLTRGQYETYTNPLTGEPLIFNKNTGQFEAGPQGAGFGTQTFGGGQIGNQGIEQLPPIIRGAASQDINGQSFIVESRVPKGLENAALIYAGQLGIPILDKAQASGIEKIDASIGNTKILSDIVEAQLKPGIGGRIVDVARTKLNEYFQTEPELGRLAKARQNAIVEIQGLAGDAPGLRLNKNEIDAAAATLPTPADNLGYARAKLKQAIQTLENQRQRLYVIAGGKNLNTLTAEGGKIDVSKYNF